MKTNLDSKNLLWRYLLRDLTEAEALDVEEQVMTNKRFFESLLMAEDDLIDAYTDGTLSADERSRFETQFLVTTERRRKLRFARALKDYIDRDLPAADSGDQNTDDVGESSKVLFSISVSRGLLLNVALVILLCISVAAIAWFVIGRSRLQTTIERERERVSLLERELERVKRPSAPGTAQAIQRVLSVSIPGGIVRDGGAIPTVSLPSVVEIVRLRISSSAISYRQLRAQVVDGDGREVFTSDNLVIETDGPETSIIVDVPVGALKPNDYQVRLAGANDGANFEGLGNNQFRVIKR